MGDTPPIAPRWGFINFSDISTVEDDEVIGLNSTRPMHMGDFSALPFTPIRSFAMELPNGLVVVEREFDRIDNAQYGVIELFDTPCPPKNSHSQGDSGENQPAIPTQVSPPHIACRPRRRIGGSQELPRANALPNSIPVPLSP